MATPPTPARRPSRHACSPRTPAPGGRPSSTRQCGPTTDPHLSPAARADRADGGPPPCAGHPRTTASRPRSRRRRAPRAARHRPRGSPRTPEPSGEGRCPPARPGRARSPAADSACGSSPARTSRPGAARRARPRNRSAVARAGCPPRFPSPGVSRPERDLSQPESKPAVPGVAVRSDSTGRTTTKLSRKSSVHRVGTVKAQVRGDTPGIPHHFSTPCAHPAHMPVPRRPQVVPRLIHRPC